MRILVIANSLVRSSLGGGDMLAFQMAKHWKKHVQTVGVVLPKIGASAWVKVGAPKEHFHVLSNSAELNLPFAYVLRATRTCLSHSKFLSYDVLYTASDYLSDTIPAFFLKLIGKRVWIANIYHVISQPSARGGSLLTNILSFIAQRVSFVLIKSYADAIFVLNSSTFRLLESMGFKTHKLKITGAGIDVEEMRRLDSSGEEFDGCFMGRLHPTKGVLDLVRIWKRVCMRVHNAKLLILCDANELWVDRLRKEIARNDLENRVQIATTWGEEARRRMKQGKVFVFPSHEEGWGISICEAMASGIPVVAYDLPVYREFFNRGVVFVKPFDTELFADEVVNLLLNSDKRRIIGSEGKTEACRYDWNYLASKQLNYIQTCCIYA